MSVSRHGRKWRTSYRDVDSGQVVHRPFDTQREAREFDREQALLRRGFVTMPNPLASLSINESTSPTVAEYARDLVDSPGLKQNTRDAYAVALRRIEREPLGQMQVARVKPGDIRAFDRSVIANRHNVIAVLGKVFNAAVREGIIASSPVKQAGVMRPAREQKRLRVLTVAEVERLAAAATLERDALAIRLGAYVGLRAGEVGGLRVEDVDFGRHTIEVRSNAQRTSKGYEVGTPKSKSSTRRLQVPLAVIEAIASFLERHPANPDGLILTSAMGNPVTDQLLTHATVQAAEAAGLQRVTFHDLRHTCASLLIAGHNEPKSVQRYLGHSSIRMTFDLYGHLYPNADEPLAAGMQSAIEEARAS